MAGRTQSDHISETDFAGLLDALTATAKGRSFLSEYVRRFRPQETRMLLEALQRIEATVRILRDQLQPERLGSELRRIGWMLDIAIEDVRSESEAGDASRRSSLLTRASADLAALADGLATEGAPAGEPPQDDPGPDMPARDVTEPADIVSDDLLFLDQLPDR